ncbi:D-glycerate dehydrogenase [Maritimibacter sp. UBA3975]|uniref:2-hydroxyacid dehydrogenase n=1 Tax=Maritimibacter sp. UBA3975 TaxID=1946833 RepID=UPI000C0B8913|nr:D-glycerate dehydrogenase [Maritimibacter sp. UBA3975]MAM59953.1 D-glycerate dehydrogenase [Maritimibacter sp.]|tara:strand:+ start:50011 stop:50988 length:978 start_codon:yes stop_codon:yes gene_type:complete
MTGREQMRGRDCPRVLLCCTLPDPVVAALTDGLDLTAKPLSEVTPKDAADGLIVSVETPLGSATVARLPAALAAIGTYSVGTEHIDRAALARRGIALLSTPDVLSASVAEIAVFLALGAVRRATESIALVRSGAWTGWTPGQLLGHELAGHTAGIFGMGRIGREIAARLSGMGMTIAYHNRSRLKPEDERSAAYHPTLQGLAAACDVLVIACPASAATEGVVDAQTLAAMRPGSYVVNVARGTVVDDAALIAALSSGQIAGAGLDVIAREPDFDPRYLDLPNAFLLPHIGSSTVEARVRMGAILRDGFIALARGETPPNLVPEPV